jgi:hypothetical protein
MSHVRSKLSETLNVYYENMFSEKYIEISDHSNIGSDYQYFKLIIRLTISIIARPYCWAKQKGCQ